MSRSKTKLDLLIVDLTKEVIRLKKGKKGLETAERLYSLIGPPDTQEDVFMNLIADACSEYLTGRLEADIEDGQRLAKAS